MEIDLIQFLTDHEISFRDRGKNVSKGWINLEICPFCGDSSFHCGVNLESLGFHCWVCDEKGFFIKLLKEMEQFKKENLTKTLAKYEREGIFSHFEDNNQRKPAKSKEFRDTLEWPEPLFEGLNEPHRKYLLRRGFDPDLLIKKYKLKSIWNEGIYRFRIIAPIIINKKPVSWIAASCLDKQICKDNDVIRYLNCPPEKAITPVNHCLYNYDSIKDFAVIVEGITDVWNCGDGFVATFRKGITSEQMELLLKKNPQKVFVMYDSDAIKQSREVANTLSGLFSSVEVVELSDGDPGDLKKQDVIRLKEFLGI